MYKAANELYHNRILRKYVTEPFNRVTYQGAVSLFRENGFAIEPGDDFGSEEERGLCRILNGLPTFVTHYPSDPRPREGGVIKFFSMKRSGTETLCCDLLLPNVGESVGGAVREGSADTCRRQFQESYMYDHLTERGIDPAQFNWYFETLGQAGGQSSGCGIGFERVVQSVLATEQEESSIKMAIELPRSPEYLIP